MIEWMITGAIPIGNLHMFLLELSTTILAGGCLCGTLDAGPGSLVKWLLKNDDKVDHQRGILFSDKAIVVLLESSI
jgi:hypothetical protein